MSNAPAGSHRNPCYQSQGPVSVILLAWCYMPVALLTPLRSHNEEEALCLQAEQERQADHWSAGPGPSSSSSSAAPLSMPRSSSLTTAPSFATAAARLPLPAADPRQPLLHQVGAVRHGPGRQPFPAPQPALHSIPSQVGTESLLLPLLFLCSLPLLCGNASMTLPTPCSFFSRRLRHKQTESSFSSSSSSS